MERVYAFIDEYGQFGWEFEKPDVSSCFIIAAVLVKESDLEEYTCGAEIIRKRYFQTGEMKSSKIAGNHNRRKKVLEDIGKLPCKIFAVVIDKQTCWDNMNIKGLKYKKTFYKFMNNIVHQELRYAFNKMTIVADEIGDNDYMMSFCNYVDSKQDIANLLGEAQFTFRKSTNDVRIQVADIISGSLGRIYDKNKNDEHGEEFFAIIEKNIIRIEHHPKTYANFSFDDSAITAKYDRDIAKMCFSRAVTYLKEAEQSVDYDDEYGKARIIVLKYLLFRFMNNDKRGYIPTRELISQLEHTGLRKISDQAFRSNVIGKLRDEKVIIASSNKGYKIPTRLKDIMDYVSHDARVVMPMLSRLSHCRELVKMNTLNSVDLLDGTGLEKLKWFFDNYPEEEDIERDR